MAMRPRTAAQNNSMRRAIVGLLATAQCLMGVPVPAQPAGTTRRPPAAPTVRVNRTVPPVKPPAAGVHFSAQPTVAEIFQARVFAEPLVPVGGVPSDAETRALADGRRGGRRCKATSDASCGRAAPSAAPWPRGMTPGNWPRPSTRHTDGRSPAMRSGVPSRRWRRSASLRRSRGASRPSPSARSAGDQRPSCDRRARCSRSGGRVPTT